MRNIDLLIFGYVKFKIDFTKADKFFSYLLASGIPIISKDDGIVYAFYKDKAALINAFDKCGVDYAVLKEYDALRNKDKIPTRICLCVSVIISILVVVYLSGIVWYIEISGNETVSDAIILNALKKCNFYVGSQWKDADLGKIEVNLQSKEPNISWVSVNRNGCVAYITVVESKANNSEITKEEGYYNIIAKEDCIIENISVSKGTPVVNVGDTVKKGDLLVLGMISTGEKIEYCAAEAVVIGRVNKVLSVAVDRKTENTEVKKSKLVSCKIKIFEICVNIFKKYSNLNDKCVIIEKKEKISLFGMRPLPVEVIKQYSLELVKKESIFEDNELIEIAGYRMRSVLDSVLKDVDLNSIKTYGAFIDQGYIMTSEVVYSCDVSEPREFFLNEK